MDRVENDEVKEYITEFAIEKLEACDVFVQVFGKDTEVWIYKNGYACHIKKLKPK